MEKSDLYALVELIKSDFPTQERREDFRITSYFDGFDISENSLEDFLSHKKLPYAFSRLSFRLIGWSKGGDINKSLSLTFWDNYISLTVDGDSESWVKGKCAQLIDFLKEKRPVFWFLKTTPVYLLGGALVPIVLTGAASLISKGYETGPFGWTIPVGLGFLSALYFAVGKFSYTRIYLQERKPILEKYNAVFIVVGFLGSIFTIISVVLELRHF